MKLALFYHLYQANNWRNMLDEQIHKVCSSGLYTACDLIHIGINGSEPLPYTLPKFKIHHNAIITHECDTLFSLWKFCASNPDYNVLYFHNKGISHYNNLWQSYTTNAWRLYLEYFNIIRWQDCVEKLKEHDVVGTEYITVSNYWDSKRNWREENNPHYSGNFWWANSNYVKTLDPNYVYSDEDNNIKLRTEFWICSKQPKHFNFYNTNAECRYGHTYIPTDYMTI